MPKTDPVGDHDTDTDLVLALLAENADKAHTKPEIHRGIDEALAELVAEDTVTKNSSTATANP